MVDLVSVSKTYFGHSRVLERVNLKLKQGEFLYVIGGSGAGKSSLLRILATEEAASGGQISLFGYDLSRVSPSTLRTIRRALGYVPQGLHLIPDLTVMENIALSLSLSGNRALTAESKRKILEILERLHLTDRREKKIQTLSGGEAQRVAVARALARAPELIIADEPTGAQDKDTTWTMMDLLLKANVMGSTVVLATHDREIVRRVRKRCAVLRGGHVVLEDGLL